jgi:putative DNA primase/helicase
MGHGYEGTAVQSQFEAAMVRRGLVPPQKLIADGRIHRCSTKAKNGRGDGSYLLHLDGAIPAGGFQNFQDGLEWENWSFDPGRKLTNSERQEIKSKAEAAEKAREQAKAHDQAKAAEKARRLWDSAADVVQPHAYLARKGIMPHGVRLKYGRLVVPISDALGALTSLQFIRPDGSKTFLRGGRVRGGFHLIGGDEGRIVICEGFATAASVHGATGCTVVVAFNAGNLKAVGEAVRTQCPDANVIVGADDDWKTKGNPGLAKATEAARAIGAKLAVPNFGVSRRDRDTDFHDLAAFIGTDAVRRCIDAAAVPEPAPEEIDPNVEIERLRKLDPIAYERERSEAAKRLGVRPSILDRQVAAGRQKSNGDGRAGRPLTFREPEPWPEPVDGAELLSDLSAVIRSYVIVSSCQADALALWVVFTHSFDAFDVAPKIILKSPEKRCGKTRLAQVLARLVAKPLFASSITPSALLRSIELHAPTVLLDEMDAAMKKDREMAEALRGLINSGFDRAGAKHIFNVPTPDGGFEPREFSTWAPQMLSGIGGLQDTVRDRSVEMEMRRKRPDEKVKRLRRRDGADLDILCRKATRWAMDNLIRLRDATPEMPAGLDDRAADAWEPLVAIGDAAGAGWPKRSREVALALSGDGVKEDDSVRGILLADISRTFTARGLPQMPTAELIEQLVAVEGHPWAEWKGGKPITPTGLARLLAPFKIFPSTIRVGDSTSKGYRLADFADAFSRYCPQLPPAEPSHRHNADETGTSGGFQAVTPDRHVTAPKSQKPASDGHCDGVTDESSRNGGWPQESARDAIDGANGGNHADASAGEPELCAHCGRADGGLQEAWLGGEHFWLHPGCQRPFQAAVNARAAQPTSGTAAPGNGVRRAAPAPVCEQCGTSDGDLRKDQATLLDGSHKGVRAPPSTKVAPSSEPLDPLDIPPFLRRAPP